MWARRLASAERRTQLSPYWRISERGPSTLIEATWWREGYRRVAGVDEVGRGALFGPVVAAAVIFPVGWTLDVIPGLATPNRHSGRCASDCSGACWQSLRPLPSASARRPRWTSWASRPRLCVPWLKRLKASPCPPRWCSSTGSGRFRDATGVAPAVDADALCACTAAASIVAKVTRDRLVRGLALSFPGYHLDENVGYGTPAHLAALAERGPTPLHRRSFAPVTATVSR